MNVVTNPAESPKEGIKPPSWLAVVKRVCAYVPGIGKASNWRPHVDPKAVIIADGRVKESGATPVWMGQYANQLFAAVICEARIPAVRLGRRLDVAVSIRTIEAVG